MNLPKSEEFNVGWTRMFEVAQDAQIRFRNWLRSEISDARFYYVRFRAENGDALNEYRYGLMYEKGERGLRSDYEAHKWFLRAAFQGNVEAQAKVSEYHRIGRGVPLNAEEAFKWCRKAAEQGHPPSQRRLAQMYANGFGVERNPREASKWNVKAATQRIPTAEALEGQLSVC
ncbi:MAG TPA: tetratricopeptide repeat protein [Candidatus Paceibacterota bacterium]|nr:tetratricopeptide repeat protein [Candidatus Paceibacterota bacterium]